MKSAHALYKSGCVARRKGEPSKARDLFRQAIGALPTCAEYHHAAGLASMELGDYDEAKADILRAVRLGSRPEFHNSLGTMWKRQGRLAEAIRSYRQAVRQNAGWSLAHHNLGDCYRLAGQLERAIDSFRRATVASPRRVESFLALAGALSSSGRIKEAIHTFEAAWKLAPDDANVARELGDAYQDAGRLVDAVAVYGHALSLDPDSALVFYGLGCAELARGEFVESSRSFREALARRSGWVQAEHNLGCALFHLGRTDEALARFQRCAESEDAGNAALARAMAALIVPQAPSADNHAILACRRRWAAEDLPKGTPRKRRKRPGTRSRRPIRIGYLSSFFHRPNWMKPVWALVNQHDRSEFEIHLLSAAPPSQIQWGYHAQPRDRLHHIGPMSNQELARFIRTLRIDVLVDLNSYSDMRRLPLLAARPAPVVVAWFNLYATSGMEAVDCLIGDDQVIPKAEEPFYTERIRRVSGSYLTFSVGYPVPEVAAPPCLTRPAITFGSLASQIKITGDVIAAWSRILERSEGSTLFVKNRALGSVANREFVYGQFAEHGIPRGRVRLEGPAEHHAFLTAYDEMDIALDTFPYNGGTTTTEAIWQGVPVVTFWGDRWLSRTSASILRAGALGSFVRRDLDDYISFASELANRRGTRSYLAELRRGMRASLLSSAVCDAKSLARQIEAIYREAHRQ